MVEPRKSISRKSTSRKSTSRKSAPSPKKSFYIHPNDKKRGSSIKTPKRSDFPAKIQNLPLLKTPECLSHVKNISLQQHQLRIVKHLQRNRGVIAAHGTGSGKTLTSIAVSQCLMHSEKGWKAIVITPPSLQKNYLKEMKKFGLEEDDPRYTFYTPILFEKAFDEGKIKCHCKTLLIIDEAHSYRTKISKTTTRRVMSVIECAKNVGKVLLLTATPVYNILDDLQNLISIVKGIDPFLKKKDWEDFLSNPHNFECIFSFYAEKSQDSFPSVKEKYVRIPMKQTFLEQYEKILETKEEELNKVFGKKIDPYVFFAGVRMACNAIFPNQKAEYIARKLKKEPEKKSVIYSAFRDKGLKIIQKYLETLDIPFLEITGTTAVHKRQDIVEEFNEKDGDVNVLFITKAGGEGLDLKGVRNIFIYESGWNRSVEEQVIGRGVRFESHKHLPKEERHVDVYHLLMVYPEGVKGHSADEILFKGVQAKLEETRKLKKKLQFRSIENKKC